MKQKHFHKGIEQLVQEGAIQYYKTLHTNQIILGAVGQLQFEVFEHRMNNEYNVDVVMEPVGRKIARWIENEDDIKDNMNTSRSILVHDRYDNYVFYLKTSLQHVGLKKSSQTLNYIVYYNMFVYILVGISCYIMVML